MTYQKLIRPLVQKLHGYVPGEQPKIKGLIKLNTNENPYPLVAQSALAVAIKARRWTGGCDCILIPRRQKLREKLAKLHRCQPENILCGKRLG